MGEATYYFKAVFDSEAAAQKALAPFKQHLRKHDRAQHEWKASDEQSDGHTSPAKLHQRLRRHFPEVLQYVDRHIEDCSSEPGLDPLAILLICTCDSDGPYRHKNEIRLSAFVWSFDNWAPLLDYAREVLKCRAVGFLSDEYIPDEFFFDAIARKDEPGGKRHVAR